MRGSMRITTYNLGEPRIEGLARSHEYQIASKCPAAVKVPYERDGMPVSATLQPAGGATERPGRVSRAGRRLLVSGGGTPMARIRRILVAVKELQAKSLPAVLKAAQVAGACGAQLELFHALTTPLYVDLYSQPLDALEQELKQQARIRLESIADRLRQHGLKVTACVEWDAPVFEAIVRRARQSRADLIVVSRYAGRHAAPALMQLTDWELVRVSPTPVLLVGNSRPYRHPAVLAAIDPRHAFAKPMKLDKIILRMAGSLSKSLRGTLHAVYA